MTHQAAAGIPRMDELMEQFQQLNAQFLAAWGKALEAFLASPAGQQATLETERNYVAARATLARAARDAWGPLIEAAGAVPLSEFQRLADQVHLVLQRLDAIDDRLEALAERDRPLPSGQERVDGPPPDKPKSRKKPKKGAP